MDMLTCGGICRPIYKRGAKTLPWEHGSRMQNAERRRCIRRSSSYIQITDCIASISKEVSIVS